MDRCHGPCNDEGGGGDTEQCETHSKSSSQCRYTLRRAGRGAAGDTVASLRRQRLAADGATQGNPFSLSIGDLDSRHPLYGGICGP